MSQRVGEYYAMKRGVPAANVIRIRTAPSEAIERAAYAATIEAPIAAAIARAGLQDRILYLVLTKGVPLRIAGTPGANGTAGSVDSELTLLYRKMVGQPVASQGRVDNPYFLGGGSAGTIARFTHREHDIYLVTRLDGFTEQDARALVDRGLAGQTEGRIVLDGRDPLANRAAEERLRLAATRLEEQGHGARVLHDATAAPVRTSEPMLGYYWWGSLDPEKRQRRSGLTFAPGAIAASFVPSAARTFEAPPDAWVPSMDDRLSHGGTPHSLIGDLIQDGVTGVAGYVADPFMQGMVRPETLFPAYLGGANLAEAFYLATPYLSWQGVVVGDPLAAPFRDRPLTPSEIDEPVEDATQLPALFGRRVVARMQQSIPGVSEAAAIAAVRANVLLGRADAEGARQALEQAVALAPRAVPWQFALASIEEQTGRRDAAVARYRAVIERDPKHVPALNNLAYALAVHEKTPADALPLATRAAALAPQAPAVLDTLGWVHHLLGNEAEAVNALSRAVKGAPNDPLMRLHLAEALAASGARTQAENELAQALKLNPALGDQQEVRDLRARIAALPASPPRP